MKQIELKYVRKDNTNLRAYSDSLWRALRKERFKKADPDKFVNQQAAEQLALNCDEHTDFKKDVTNFINSKLTKREGQIFSLFVFGGKIGQTDIGKILGVCQATVANDLHCAQELFKEWFYAGGEYGYYPKTKENRVIVNYNGIEIDIAEFVDIFELEVSEALDRKAQDE